MADDRNEPTSATDPYGLLHAGDAGILGIDNVRLEMPVAGIGSRMLAVSLDQIAIVIGIGLWVAFCLAAGAALQAWLGTGLVAVWVILIIGAFLIDFAYYSICEIRMGGRTPGKKALGLRTVSSLGGQASVAAILVRNALRLFDYLVGTLLVMVDRRNRRLGDWVAGTQVIHDPVEPPEEAELGRWPASFTSREIALAEQLVRRIPRLAPERARELAQQFLGGLRRRDPAFVDAAPGAPPLADPVFELWRILAIRQRGQQTGEPAGSSGRG